MNKNQQRFLQTTAAFFRHLWQGGSHAYYWTSNPNRSYWHSLDEKLPFPPRVKGANTYFGVHPVREIPKTNAKKIPMEQQFVRSQLKVIAAVSCLFSEMDFSDYESKEATWAHIQQLVPRPSVIIFSGGGYHLYHNLVRPHIIQNEADLEYIRQVQFNWVQYVGGDPASKDLSRVLRCPGFRNYKQKYAPNFPRVRYVSVHLNRQYTLGELDLLSRPIDIEEPAVTITTQRPVVNGNANSLAERALATAAQMIRLAPDGQKHNTLLRSARLMGGYISGGIILEQEAITMLQQEIAAKPNVQSLKLAEQTIRDGIAYGKAEPIFVGQPS